MADPLSLTGTAVGVVSLGIQVCQGLFSYLQAVRGRHKEVKDGITEAQALLEIFQAINDVLPDFEQQDRKTASLLLSCLTNNEFRVLELKQTLDHLKQSVDPATDLKSKMKRSGKALAYPFREENMRQLQNSASRLLQGLQLGMQVAGLKADVSRFETNRFGRLQNGITSQKNAITSLGNNLQKNTDKIDTLKTAMTDFESKINMHLSQIKAEVSTLDKRMEGLDDTNYHLTKEVVQGMSEVKQMMARSQHQGQSSAEQLHRQLLCQMELLQSIQSHLVSASQQKSTNASYLRPPSTNNLIKECEQCAVNKNITAARSVGLCSCMGDLNRTTRASAELLVLSISVTKQVRGHRPGCPLSKVGLGRTKKTMSLRTKVGMLSYFMGVVEAGLSFTVDRLGGFQISPFIKSNNIVSRYASPVLAAISESCGLLQQRTQSNDEIEGLLRSLEHKIVSLYQTKQSCPTDLTGSGETHIGFALVSLAFTSYVLEGEAASVVLENTERILQTMLNCGASVNDFLFGNAKFSKRVLFFSASAYSASCRWQANKTDDTMLCRFFRATNVTIKDFSSYYSEINLPGLTSSLPDVLDGMSISPLIRAILARSPRQLAHEIAQHPQETTKLTRCLTVIQWSVGWPQGLRLLLNTAARALIDATGYLDGKPSSPPIKAALKIECVRSLKTLLEAGCDLYIDDSYCRQPGARILAIEQLIEPKSVACVSVFLRHLASRRKELLQLAHQHLPNESIQQNGSSTYIPDGNASYLCAELDKAGVLVPKRLRVPEGLDSVYHLDVPLKYFSMLLEAGFRDWNLLNEIGLRPIMVWREETFEFEMLNDSSLLYTFATIKLMGSLGLLDTLPADRRKLGVNTRATGWHFLACLFGATLFLDSRTQVADDRNLTIVYSFLDHLRSKPADGCNCWCNLNGEGCSPMISLYKSHCRPLRPEMGMKYEDQFTLISESTTSWIRHAFFHRPVRDLIPLDGNNGQKTPSNRTLEMVRFLTFEALDMTHTCCRVRCLFHDGMAIPPCSDGSWPCRKHIALKCCDPEFVREIQKEQQQTAEHLTTLMSEFTEVLTRMSDSPRALGAFIFGYWRRRMAKFYAVNSEAVEAMNLVVPEVKTYVTPEPIKRLLGDDFTFRLDSTSGPEFTSKEFEGTEHMDKVAYDCCEWCDGLESSDDEAEEREEEE